jgi:aminopeptidase-like protein
MNSATATAAPVAAAPLETGPQLHALLERLFPICRSLTGDGVRQTLAIVREYLPALRVHEVPSGTPVLDWTVPAEWNIRDAWVKNATGKKVIDFQEHNLHVLGYSTPVRGWFTRQELEEHLYSLPEQPTLIPYRTSYYSPAWGFCLPHQTHLALPDGDYEVCIDSTLDATGSLTYGELLLPATVAGEELAEEVLLSCHCCHPSLANDNLSGLVVAVALARQLAALPTRRYAYRFVFGPGTIGSITWLARNPEAVARIQHGLVLTLLGGPGAFTYKQSRRGMAIVDQAAALVLAGSAVAHDIRPWLPYGYDERQYCSPGFNLPVGCLSRTPFGEFAEYHTSADNPDFVQSVHLEEALAVVRRLCFTLDRNRTYRNLQPYGEPHLGRRGLYKGVGGGSEGHAWQMALLWVLSLSDGKHSLLDIAAQSGVPFELLHQAAQALAATDLLAEASG